MASNANANASVCKREYGVKREMFGGVNINLHGRFACNAGEVQGHSPRFSDPLRGSRDAGHNPGQELSGRVWMSGSDR